MRIFRSFTKQRPGPERRGQRPIGRPLTRLKLALAIAAVVGMAAAGVMRAEIIEEIVARINDDIISLSRLKERESRVITTLFSRYSGEELDENVRVARSMLVQDLIRETLMLQRAETLGLETSKIIEMGLEDIKRQNDIKTQGELLRILREQGTTLDEVREQILRVRVPPIVINLEVRQKVSVSDAEIESYYESNIDEFRVPETVTFSELVLRFSDDVDKDDVRARVEEILAEVKAGAGFDALVQKYSEVPSREANGRVGPLRPKELARPIERALRSLEPGIVSPIIESRFGMHLVRLDERIEERLIDIAEVRDDIEDRIRQEKTNTEIEAYFNKLMEENFIRISPAYENYPES